jgi:hypothetical protein
MASTPPKPLIGALSAAAGSALTAITFYPLEHIKTRLQAQVSADGAASGFDVARELLRRGLLWHGVGSVLLRSVLADSLYFLVNGRIDERARRLLRRKMGAIESMMCGVLSGCTAMLVCHPVELVCQRHMCDDQGRSARWHLRELVRTLGVFGLWRGISVNFMLSLNPALTFGVFERAKRLLLAARSSQRSLSASQLFALGMLTKICTLTAVYPLIRGKIRYQATVEKSGAQGGGDGAAAASPPSLLGAMREVVEHEGAGGLYTGWREQIAKSALSTALLLTTKEKIAGAIERAVGY